MVFCILFLVEAVGLGGLASPAASTCTPAGGNRTQTALAFSPLLMSNLRKVMGAPLPHLCGDLYICV